MIDSNGCNIKIYETQNCSLFLTLKRGINPKFISDIKFSKKNNHLALISIDSNIEKDGTLHIFDMKNQKKNSRK